jgi:hypothetical protein
MPKSDRRVICVCRCKICSDQAGDSWQYLTWAQSLEPLLPTKGSPMQQSNSSTGTAQQSQSSNPELGSVEMGSAHDQGDPGANG